MIPPDVASRLRLITQDLPAPPQPVTPLQKLTDILSDLVPGQRLMAEIQALLPNGTYRAMVAQRDVTLALPFSAKPGDALELEVVESDGKLTLAVVADRGATARSAGESVSATLSQTGRLIGDLLGKVDENGKKATPTPLNGNQPLVAEFPEDPAQLAPVLKEALVKSGMFYESHQARWAEGKLPTAALLQEPQGRLSPGLSARDTPPEIPRHTAPDAAPPPPGETAKPALESVRTAVSPETDSSTRPTPQNPIAPELAPLVRQQLDALATQNFVWQGQVWPGQEMRWEIEEQGQNRQNSPDDAAVRWQTRLSLSLPALGGIEATLRLGAGGRVEIALVADSDQSRQRLAAGGAGLQRQFADAGLDLTSFSVQHGKPAP